MVRLTSDLFSAPISDELKMFQDVKKLNWAWAYEKADGTWTQFECVPCMILESKWSQWQQDKSLTFELPIGTIFFERMTAELINKKAEVKRVHKIKRT